MNYLPNDMIAEILQYVKLKQLIESRFVSKRFSELIASTFWHHQVFNFRYLMMGFKFADCSLYHIGFDKDFDEWPKRLDTGLSNLSRCKSIKFTETKITSPLAKFLHKIPEIKFFSCRFFLEPNDYKIFSNVNRITFSDCRGMIVATKMNIHSFAAKCGQIEQVDLANLIDVEDLNLSSCNLSIQRELPDFRSSKLNISGSTVSDYQFESFRFVQTLKCSGCAITDVALQFVTNIPALDISYCYNITDNGLKYLSNVISLRLSGCNITNDGLQYLTDVKSLELKQCWDITDHGLVHLANVTELDLSYCDKLTGTGFGSLASIKKINLSYCTGITDDTLQHLAHAIECNIIGCSSITNDGLRHLADIEVLRLSANRLIDDDGLRNICDVNELHIIHCTNITDRGLSFLHNVRVLDLNVCHGITNTGLGYLARLDKLHITENSKITDDGLVNLSNLKLIHFFCCPGITSVGADVLEKQNVRVSTCLCGPGTNWYTDTLLDNGSDDGTCNDES